MASLAPRLYWDNPFCLSAADVHVALQNAIRPKLAVCFVVVQ